MLKQKIGLIIISVIFMLMIIELSLSYADFDLMMLRKYLYYQGAFLPLHRVSSNVQRLYELVPDTSMTDVLHCTHYKEPKYQNIILNINSLGFRGKDWNAAKKPGVFRIVIFGGSNTFGASVSDDDTYPARMQRIFDEICSGKVEVWNAGVCAYVMSQNLDYAEEVIRKFYPDLLIIQEGNIGRRAFHHSATLQELKILFQKNKELYAENMPLLWSNPNPIAVTLHNFFVTNSHFYRLVCLGVYSYCNVGNISDPDFKGKYGQLWYQHGQMVSEKSLDIFLQKHREIPIVWFFHDGNDRSFVVENVRSFRLDRANRSEEYSEAHPPSYVYQWIAEELVAFLMRNGYIPPIMQEIF